MSYKSSLDEFKKSLKGGSEVEEVVEEVVKNTPTARIRWFDVGISNGKFLRKIVDRLEDRGFIVEVSGMDPSKESVKKARENFPNSDIYYGDFLDHEIKGKYDVFSFNQSLYYFSNKDLVVEKCLDRLSEGGIILGVLWSKKDSIYKYHKEVFGDWTLGAVTSEDFVSILASYEDIQSMSISYFEGSVDFSLWKDSESSFLSSINVIGRIVLDEDLPEAVVDKAKSVLQDQKDFDKRINGVVVGKKGYRIRNLDRTSMEYELKKRFPSYENLINNIKGDNESLFMASWEEETKYLSEKFKPGRVLEICCASGLKSVILAKRHNLVGIDIDENRLGAARSNADLFGVSDKVKFINVDASKKGELAKLGDFDVIMVDADWRENLEDPIKKQNIDPFKTTPRTDKLYHDLREMYPNVPIVFKVSPFVRVSDMKKLDYCRIEELYIGGKFLSYNVYFHPKLEKSSWTELHLNERKN